MFTFGEHQMPIIRLSSIPDIKQPRKMQPLSNFPFYIESTEILPLDSVGTKQIQKQKDTLQKKVQALLEQNNKLTIKYNQLYQDYTKRAKQCQHITAKYREGEKLFQGLEKDNIRLQNQVQALKNKNESRGKVSVTKKVKQIPVIRVSVPNPKLVSQQNEKQSMYRQLKAASDDLMKMKKNFESEKQKSEYNQSMQQKYIQQLTVQRDSLKHIIMGVKEENKILKQQLNRLKQLPGGLYQPIFSNRQVTQSEKQHHYLKAEFQRLQKVHRSCQVLLESKNAEVQSLKNQIKRMMDQKRVNTQSDHISRVSFINSNSNKKDQTEITSLFPDNSAKKTTNLYNTGDYLSVLEKHMQISVKQIKSIQQFVKYIVEQFIRKIEGLKAQLQWSSKKIEHQKFQLDRVYQLLKDKKQELQNCYHDLRLSRQNNTPVKVKDQEYQIKQILRGRRNFTA